MKPSQLKLTIIFASILYGIYIVKVLSNDGDYIKARLEERYFKRAIPEYVMLLCLLLLIAYAFVNEKDKTTRRAYLSLISLAIATAITSLSTYVKLLTLPAFTVIFFWALTHSFI